MEYNIRLKNHWKICRDCMPKSMQTR